MRVEVRKDVEAPRKNALFALEIATNMRLAKHSAYPSIYARKLAEAQSGQYVLLAEEAALRGTTPEALAEKVLAKNEQALVFEQQIELERIACKMKITSASNREQVVSTINAYLDVCASEGVEISGLRMMVRVDDRV